MNNAILCVLTSSDLFQCITSFQYGIVENLQPIYRTKGLWTITFSPRDFIAMHCGPFGKKREALLQCIIWDRSDLVIDFFRCFPTYAQDDYRFKEIVDAALILNRLDLFMILFQHRPMYECTPRVFLQAALRGHKLEHVQHIIAGKRRKRNEAYNERNVHLKNLD
ncbi:hypothetical protein THRCLA_21988 [Thraustotheca clavata]|uniref:Uncharacterized protein n=1 Tax=Thraustotheca clavata TaxID=74557 RepID=A0A1V9ZFB5_9STRA|nr:hypothetical protein THRCLA_21988 [Thraustotheca clavata]